MIGFNGGLLGVRRESSVTAAPGLWFQNEQSIAKRAGIWPVNGDAYFNNVSVLLHMDGSNGSTTFADNSGNALTATVNGDAKISTANYKFGTGSLLVDGTGDFLSYATSSLFQFGTGDFTIECFIKESSQTTTTMNQLVASTSSGFTTAGSFALRTRVFGAAKVGFTLRHSSGWHDINSATAVNDSNWHHIAVTRTSATIKLFVDGIVAQSGTIGASDVVGLTEPLSIGGAYYGNGTEGNFIGNIDDFRITKGVARYTTNFTPTSTPFPDS